MWEDALGLSGQEEVMVRRPTVRERTGGGIWVAVGMVGSGVSGARGRMDAGSVEMRRASRGGAEGSWGRGRGGAHGEGARRREGRRRGDQIVIGVGKVVFRQAFAAKPERDVGQLGRDVDRVRQ